jgi:hypothetical protein
MDPEDVQACLKSDVQTLLKDYIRKDKSIGATPTVHVNGKKAGTSFRKIKTAICSVEPSLQGCKAADPSDADWEPELSKPGTIVV